MKPLLPEELKESDEMVGEYARLTLIATEALLLMPIRGRPNWVLFYAAQDQISSLVARIKKINDT